MNQNLNFISKISEIALNPKEIIHFLNKAVDAESNIVLTEDGEFLHNYNGPKKNIRKIVKNFDDLEYFETETTLKDIYDFMFTYKFELENYFALKKWGDVTFVSQMIEIFTNENFIDSGKSFDFYQYYVNYSKNQTSDSIYSLLKINYDDDTLKTDTLIPYTENQKFYDNLKELSIYFPCKEELEQVIQTIWPKYIHELMLEKSINTNDLVYDILDNINLWACKQVLDCVWIQWFLELYNKLSSNFAFLINELENFRVLDRFLQNRKSVDLDTLAALTPDELYNFSFLYAEVWNQILKMERLVLLLTSNFTTEFKKYLKWPQLFKKHTTEHFNDFLEMFIKR